MNVDMEARAWEASADESSVSALVERRKAGRTRGKGVGFGERTKMKSDARARES